jgi:hypothetical protein
MLGWVSGFLIQALAWTYAPWVSMEILSTIAAGILLNCLMPMYIHDGVSASSSSSSQGPFALERLKGWLAALVPFILGPLLQNTLGYEEEAPFLSVFFWKIQNTPSSNLLTTNVFSRWLWSDPGTYIIHMSAFSPPFMSSLTGYLQAISHSCRGLAFPC